MLTIKVFSMLNNRDIRDKYTLTQRNNFYVLQNISETPTLNDEYENFVNVHLETAAEWMPTKQRAKPRVYWETLAVRKKKSCRTKYRLSKQLEQSNQYQNPVT